MFARVLTLHVRLEKKPELVAKVLKDIVPIVKRTAGPLEIFVLQDEIELDRMMVMSLWETKEDADRYHATGYEKVKAVLEPYLTFPPALRTYKVDDTAPWNLLTPQSDANPVTAAKAASLPAAHSR